jgi:hypothetical protein
MTGERAARALASRPRRRSRSAPGEKAPLVSWMGARGESPIRSSMRAVLLAGAALLLAAPPSAEGDAVFSLVRIEGGASGVVGLPDGSFLYADPDRHRVLRVYPDGRRVPFAGNGADGDAVDGTRATAGRLHAPGKLAVLRDGSVLIAESSHCSPCARVLRVGPDGRIATMAGTADLPTRTTYLEVGDGGPATWASLAGSWMAPLPDGGLLVADSGQGRVRRTLPDGTITTVAGTGDQSDGRYAGEGGPAVNATLPNAADVASLPDAGFLVTAANRVLRVGADGTIRTVAGTGRPGFRGDGGPAVQARLDEPAGIEPTAGGGFLVADTLNGRVRRVAADGQISTLAGDGSLDEYDCADNTESVAGLFNHEGTNSRRIGLCAPVDVAPDPLGGWLIADGRGISLLAGPGSGRMAVVITRPEAARRRVRFTAVTAGSATLELRARGRAGVARAAVKRGDNVIRLPRAAPGVYTVVLRARSRGGTADEDRLGLLLGGRLPLGLGRRLIEGEQQFSDARQDRRHEARVADAAPEYVDRCRQLGRRRVDCVIRENDYDACVQILYLRLASSGLLRQGAYRCGRGGPFRQQIPRRSTTWPYPLL